ncbi:OmpA family protein [Caldichromatium japonicum]|uniref:OmpA family protein n=1 Tax=Caldichromatium japonicum TaxID=2699430 RepID=A0A6G7VEM0_9GAMM|nr:OmpA family protein [Caldichromatium japonicum]QIK38316.1 OmpA family protein [Caldichromatium japonicum]
MKINLAIWVLAMIAGIWLVDASAEEYMKRGASVEDYEQALNRLMERKRGLVTGRERLPAAAPQTPSAPVQHAPSSARQTQTVSAARRPMQSAGAKPVPIAAASAAAGSDIYQPSANSADYADGVSIYFGYDSARLTTEAMDELNKLGQALSRPQFSQVTWLIEGHTDAMGAEDYNQRLSEQRAQATERYLVERCGIDPRRIVTIGKGERELYDPEHPAASINRRVRLRPIGE